MISEMVLGQSRVITPDGLIPGDPADHDGHNKSVTFYVVPQENY